MKLTIVTAGLDFGGAEIQIAGLAPRLAKRGWEVNVLSMLPPGPIAARLEADGVPVAHLGLARRGVGPSKIAGLGRMASRLVRELRRIRPDVVHSHMVPANIMARLVRPAARVPVLVCTAHSIVEPPAWKSLAYRLTDHLCDVTTNICRAGVEQSIRDGRVPAGRVIHVPNGVDTNSFVRSEKTRAQLRRDLGIGDRFVWLAAGRLSWEKDWPTMIRAFGALPGDSLLLVAGEGHLLAETRDAAAAAGLEERACFLGLRQDLDHLMSAADGFVMSSSVEGLPMVLLEASSCELPIVATSVGGVPEIVEPSTTGLLVPPGRPDELTAALWRIERLSAPEREAMGRAARRRIVDTYCISNVVECWISLYLQLLAGKGLHGGSFHERRTL
jgi:glycosyltransferase involved in cell wall biosynthesis